MGSRKSHLTIGFLISLLASVSLFALSMPHFIGHGSFVDAKVLKLAHSLDQQHPVHKAMVYMAEKLGEKSGGTMKIELFPDGQLGSEVECIEQVQLGILDITKTSTAALEGFVPDYAVFGVPFLFRDQHHAWNLYDSPLGEELLHIGREKGLRGLCFYDAGARSFYTIDKPIMKPEDLQGQKIRVQESKTAMEMIEAMGGSPTPMNFGELYTGLQQRMVDGAENNPPSFFTTRHFEVCKHYSLDEHSRVPDILLISQAVWEKLTPQEQEWLQECADESAEFQRELWQNKTEEVLEAVQEKGVKVYQPDRAAFAAKVKPMLDSYDGTAVGEFIQRIQATP